MASIPTAEPATLEGPGPRLSERGHTARNAVLAAIARSVELTEKSGHLLARVQRTTPRGCWHAHFAYLHAELSDRPVLALVRRDGSASGHRQWLRQAQLLSSSGGLPTERPSPSDSLVTVLSLTRACDRLDALQLVDAGNRGVYPKGPATAQMGAPWSPLSVDVDEWGELHVVRLRGELDLVTAPTMHEKLCAVACSTLQVDLTTLEFCDASGMSALLTVKRERERTGCRVSVVGARGIVRRVFEITGLTAELDD